MCQLLGGRLLVLWACCLVGRAINVSHQARQEPASVSTDATTTDIQNFGVQKSEDLLDPKTFSAAASKAMEGITKQFSHFQQVMTARSSQLQDALQKEELRNQAVQLANQHIEAQNELRNNSNHALEKRARHLMSRAQHLRAELRNLGQKLEAAQSFSANAVEGSDADDAAALAAVDQDEEAPPQMLAVRKAHRAASPKRKETGKVHFLRRTSAQHRDAEAVAESASGTIPDRPLQGFGLVVDGGSNPAAQAAAAAQSYAAGNQDQDGDDSQSQDDAENSDQTEQQLALLDNAADTQEALESDSLSLSLFMESAATHLHKHIRSQHQLRAKRGQDDELAKVAEFPTSVANGLKDLAHEERMGVISVQKAFKSSLEALEQKRKQLQLRQADLNSTAQLLEERESRLKSLVLRLQTSDSRLQEKVRSLSDYLGRLTGATAAHGDEAASLLRDLPSIVEMHSNSESGTGHVHKEMAQSQTTAEDKIQTVISTLPH